MMSALTSNITVQDQHKRYNALKNYFTAGFSYEEICSFLFRVYNKDSNSTFESFAKAI